MVNGLLLVGLFSWIEFKSLLFVHIEKRGAAVAYLLVLGVYCILFKVDTGSDSHPSFCLQQPHQALNIFEFCSSILFIETVYTNLISQWRETDWQR